MSSVDTLQSMMARAEATALQEGYRSHGKHREVVYQSIQLCKDEHWHWHPVGNPELVRCGVCHPPACEHVVVERWGG
jgi:hypothetical protein